MATTILPKQNLSILQLCGEFEKRQPGMFLLNASYATATLPVLLKAIAKVPQKEGEATTYLLSYPPDTCLADLIADNHGMPFSSH